MRPRRLITVGLGVLALLAPAAPASAAKAKDPGYTLMKDYQGAVVRWNPCVPIRYKVNVAHAPKGALADVKQAVAMLHKASGLTFVYQGQTSVIPQGDYGDSKVPGKWPPVVIAWAAPGKGKGKSDAIFPGLAGIGGSQYTLWYKGTTEYPEQFVTGLVVMNDMYNSQYKHGFGRGYTEGEVLLHELGHVVGLEHTTDPTQIMYPAANFKVKAAYGKGDLAGLKKVGKAAGCIKPKPLA